MLSIVQTYAIWNTPNVTEPSGLTRKLVTFLKGHLGSDPIKDFDFFFFFSPQPSVIFQ